MSPSDDGTRGSSSAQGLPSSTPTPRSYTNAVSKPLLNVGPKHKPVPLASRPLSYVDATPLVVFSLVEVEQLNKQRENTLIMNKTLWNKGAYCRRVAFGGPSGTGLDGFTTCNVRHAAGADTQKALSMASNKTKNYLFRLFRWSPNFEIGKDSSVAAVWVKNFNLPLQYFNESALVRMGSVLDTILRICPNMCNLSQQIYARMCIEIDVSKPLMESFFVGTSQESHWMVYLECKGNNAYCTHCGLLGHMVGLCWKKYPHLEKTNSTKDKAATSKNGKEILKGKES